MEHLNIKVTKADFRIWDVMAEALRLFLKKHIVKVVETWILMSPGFYRQDEEIHGHVFQIIQEVIAVIK